jgi:hypothetical protein
MFVLRLLPAAACNLWSISKLIEGLPGKDTGLLNYNVAWLSVFLSVTKEKALFSPPYPSEFFSALAIRPHQHCSVTVIPPGDYTGLTAGHSTGTCRCIALILYIQQCVCWNSGTAVFLLCVRNADIKRCVRVFNTFIRFLEVSGSSLGQTEVLLPAI